MENSLRYSLARTKEEIKKATDLVYQEYLRSGYVSQDDSQGVVKMGEYLGLPGAATFVLWYKDEVIGTVSIIEDSKKGIPMDDLYKEELRPFRDRSMRVAEVSQFAVKHNVSIEYSSPEKKRSTAFLSIPLLKLVIHYALSRHLDALCIAVNPKHAALYRSLGFEQFGEEKNYPSVNGAPAVAKILDLKKIIENQDQLKEHLIWNEILSNPPSPDVFDREGNACLIQEP